MQKIDYKKYQIRWWERFLLKFKRYYIGVDIATGEDYTTKVYMKFLNGKYYILKIIQD